MLKILILFLRHKFTLLYLNDSLKYARPLTPPNSRLNVKRDKCMMLHSTHYYSWFTKKYQDTQLSLTTSFFLLNHFSVIFAISSKRIQPNFLIKLIQYPNTTFFYISLISILYGYEYCINEYSLRDIPWARFILPKTWKFSR